MWLQPPIHLRQMGGQHLLVGAGDRIVFFPSTSHLMTVDWWKVHVTSCKFCMLFFPAKAIKCHSWSRTIFMRILNAHVGYCRVLQLYAAPKGEVEALKETNYSPSRPIVGTALNYVLQSVRQGPIALFKTASKHIKPNTQTISEVVTESQFLRCYLDSRTFLSCLLQKAPPPFIAALYLRKQSKECQYSQETKHGTHTDRKERKKGRKKRQKGRARKRMEKEGEKNEGQRTTRAKESETSSNVHKIGNTDRFSHPWGFQ